MPSGGKRHPPTDPDGPVGDDAQFQTPPRRPRGGTPSGRSALGGPHAPRSSGGASPADRAKLRRAAPKGRRRSRRPASDHPSRRGRPPGSRLPTGPRLEELLNLIRGGALPVTAAVAIGVPRRTFLEWVARGRGTHPTRGPTRQLREFVEAIDQAEAEVKAAAQIRLHREHLPKWLALRRPSDQEELGGISSAPLPNGPAHADDRPEPQPIHEFTWEQRVATIAGLIEAGVVPVPACPDRACRCEFHEDRMGLLARPEPTLDDDAEKGTTT